VTAAGAVLLIQRVVRPAASAGRWPAAGALDWLPNLLAAAGLPFALLALYGGTRFAPPGRPFQAECATALVVALLMETIQRRDARYTFDPADIAASVAGGALAYLLGRRLARAA
jgi:hypothetical protein